MNSKSPEADAPSLSAEALYRMSEVELLTAYAEARRQFVEKKFTRDTYRARLDWMRARMFVAGTGGVTERNMAIEVSEEIARKGQELREMTRDLDLLKADADLIAIAIRMRGVPSASRAQGEDMEGGKRWSWGGHRELTVGSGSLPACSRHLGDELVKRPVDFHRSGTPG